MGVALVGFAGCMLASARLYPGGTWSDRHTIGFSFWENFWCDLLSPVAINGHEHLLGSWLARAGFICFALCLLRFWPMAAAFSGADRRARAAARLGMAGAGALIAVSAVPSAMSETGHAVLVVSSASAGLLAALLLMPVLSPRADGLTRWLHRGLMLSASVTLLQYLRQGITRAHYANWLAGSQKVATGFLLLWMLRVAWLISRRQNQPEG